MKHIGVSGVIGDGALAMSDVRPLFDCHKDIFYRVLSNERIDWRHILRYVNRHLSGTLQGLSDILNTLVY